jgi:hypothetical protein
VGAQSAYIALTTVSIGSYSLVPPLIHLAHGHPGKALGSLGLRVGLPAGGGWIGFLIGLVAGGGGLGGLFAGVVAFTIGAIGGGVAAQVVDAAVLAYDEAPRF